MFLEIDISISSFGNFFIYKFNSSSVGNFSIISLGITFFTLYEATPIGALTFFNDLSTVNLSLSSQSNKPIVSLSFSFFKVSSTAVT